MKLYIAVLDEFPDYMVPTLVAHTMLGAHIHFARELIAHEDKRDEVYQELEHYVEWLKTSFKKCVVRVNRKEFMKIAALPGTYLGHENHTLGGQKACAIPVPKTEVPNVLKFAKLWKPNAS